MDAILNLAFTMHNNLGVYALLLGSGISRSSEIPTGWEITQDIVAMVKEIGKDISENARYDDLFEQLGKTQTERTMFLRKYFEPTEDERSRGAKLPTPAHQAIAQLVKNGYIKVILTTNFDRLIEIALEEIGIFPDVISSEDMLDGTPPIRHSEITIIKLHGDYRDVRTLNTPQELSNYSDRKKQLLETIFDEYGLIICGWSARWDVALREGIYRINPRWYSTFWIEPYEPSNEAIDLIKHRKATIIASEANNFFTELVSNIEAIAKFNRVHPLSVDVAIERVKKLLPHETTQIDLEDLLRNESERAYTSLANIPSETYSNFQDDDWLPAAYSNCEILLNMLATLCWYGKKEQATLLKDIVAKWATPERNNPSFDLSKKLSALLMLYIGGIAALYKQNWFYLNALFNDIEIIERSHNNERIPILYVVNKSSTYDYRKFHNDRYDPISEKLAHQISPVLRRYIIQDYMFGEIFDIFEMLMALIAINNNNWSVWIPHNLGLQEAILFGNFTHSIKFWEEGGKLGKEWGFLELCFSGSQQKLIDALKVYDTKVAEIIRHLSDKLPKYAQIYEAVEPKYKVEATKYA